MKLTPREPTPEMVEAGFEYLPSAINDAIAEKIVSCIWRAMHEVAPSVPSVNQELLKALEALLEHEGERSVNGIGLESDSEALEKAKANASTAIARAKGE